MKIPSQFSYSLFEPLKKYRNFVGLIIVVTTACIFCAIMAGIKFNNSSMLISFSNVTIVKFLRGNSGFGGMLFSNIFTISIFSAVIIISSCKRYTVSIGVFFYAYYVYAQSLTLIAFVLEFGIINTFVIAFCMLIIMLAMFFLLLELFLNCLECRISAVYIKQAFTKCLPILIIIVLLLLVESLVFFMLRNYVIVLVY